MKIKILVYLFIVLTLLTSCGQKVDTNASTNDQNLNQILKLEGRNKQELNYIFYNEASKSNDITISFQANYDQKKFSRLELLQADKIVSNRVKLRDTSINNNGQFTFSLLGFVENFNKIRFFSEDGNIIFTLEVGQYNLEKINIPTEIPEKERWMLTEYVTLENANKHEIELSFSQEVVTKHYEHESIIPKKLSAKNIVKQNEEITRKDNNFSLKLNSEIELSYLEKNNLTSISYDTIFVQKEKKGGQTFVMAKVNIPLTDSLDTPSGYN